MFGTLLSRTSLLRLFAIGVFLSCLAVESAAQGCGPSITRISVRDEKGWPVVNAKVELVGPNPENVLLQGRWLTKTDSTYLISFHGSKPSGNHLLKISKEDLLPVEIPLTFAEAQFRVFDVVLATTESRNASSYRQMSSLSGTTKTEDGIPVSDVDVTAVGKDGVEYKAKSDSEGRYQLGLPPGRFRLNFTRMFFVDHAAEVDIVFVDRSLNVDATLKGRGPTSH